MRLLIFALAFALLAFQPAPEPVTVTDCLLRSGYSRAVPQTQVTTLAGTDAWAGGMGERVLGEGVNVGFEFLDDSDGARRMVSFHVFDGGVFVFVYKHADDPARRLPGDPPGTYHGDCLIKIVSPNIIP